MPVSRKRSRGASQQENEQRSRLAGKGAEVPVNRKRSRGADKQEKEQRCRLAGKEISRTAAQTCFSI